MEELRRQSTPTSWITWRDLNPVGQILFCQICKNSRYSETIVADVTTLNQNVLFEIGFALGLELPVVPIRDTTYSRDHDAFDRLGFLDTLGYLDFQNSSQLTERILQRLPVQAIPIPPTIINRESPLYVLKGPIDTEGVVRLMSVLKKSAVRFRTYDPIETPRLSLQEARKHVASSIGVVANLLDTGRTQSAVHNARAALIAGMAMASGKIVLLLQEGGTQQPIDYRDVVKSYDNPASVERHLEPFIRGVVDRLQDSHVSAKRSPRGAIEKLDLGDVAAENEIRALRDYFVPTAQYQDAKRGHARLVVGRKGSGKTAIFYAIRDAFIRRRSHLVLDLKPEGHQFVKLRETVLSKLSPGLHEHMMVAFWNYILLAEMAQKIMDHEYSFAQRDPERKAAFDNLMAVYTRQFPAASGDFSERLLHQVGRIVDRIGNSDLLQGDSGAVTQLLFSGDIPELDDVVSAYLAEKEQVWILIDNLDKGWPTRGATAEDIVLLRSLLEATRRLQRQFDRRDVELHSLLFLRNDIYDHLIRETSDRGKDTAILLDWSDSEVFRQLVRERIRSSSGEGVDGTFEDMWRQLFVAHVGVEESFNYILAHTLMRPRDLLNFLHRATEVAVNRGHQRVEESDIQQALKTYSEDILLTTSFELRDVFPNIPDPLYVFMGCPVLLQEDDVLLRLMEAGIEEGKARDALSLLVWFGFLGVQEPRQAEPRYAYDVRYNVDKLMASVKVHRASLVVHPAFRTALECEL